MAAHPRREPKQLDSEALAAKLANVRLDVKRCVSPFDASESTAQAPPIPGSPSPQRSLKSDSPLRSRRCGPRRGQSSSSRHSRSSTPRRSSSRVVKWRPSSVIPKRRSRQPSRLRARRSDQRAHAQRTMTPPRRSPPPQAMRRATPALTPRVEVAAASGMADAPRLPPPARDLSYVVVLPSGDMDQSRYATLMQEVRLLFRGRLKYMRINRGLIQILGYGIYMLMLLFASEFASILGESFSLKIKGPDLLISGPPAQRQKPPSTWRQAASIDPPRPSPTQNSGPQTSKLKRGAPAPWARSVRPTTTACVSQVCPPAPAPTQTPTVRALVRAGPPWRASATPALPLPPPPPAPPAPRAAPTSTPQPINLAELLRHQVAPLLSDPAAASHSGRIVLNSHL